MAKKSAINYLLEAKYEATIAQITNTIEAVQKVSGATVKLLRDLAKLKDEDTHHLERLFNLESHDIDAIVSQAKSETDREEIGIKTARDWLKGKRKEEVSPRNKDLARLKKILARIIKLRVLIEKWEEFLTEQEKSIEKEAGLLKELRDNPSDQEKRRVVFELARQILNKHKDMEKKYFDAIVEDSDFLKHCQDYLKEEEGQIENSSNDVTINKGADFGERLNHIISTELREK